MSLIQSNYKKFEELISFNYEWYFGSLSRDETQKIMQSEPNGTFLVRDQTQDPGSFVLTVKEKTNLNKFLISPSTNGFTIGTSEYPSIPALIQHFSNNILRATVLIKPPQKSHYEVMFDCKSNTPIELSARAGDIIKFVMKYGNYYLCEKELDDNNKIIGWIPFNMLKPAMKFILPAVLMKIKDQTPFKTYALNDRYPNFFDKNQLQVRKLDEVTIHDVSDHGLLKASVVTGPTDCRYGFLPINIVKLNIKNEA